jgi:hypothetical protein
MAALSLGNARAGPPCELFLCLEPGFTEVRVVLELFGQNHGPKTVIPGGSFKISHFPDTGFRFPSIETAGIS